MITIYDGPKESNNAQITIKNRIPHGKISEFLGQLKNKYIFIRILQKATKRQYFDRLDKSKFHETKSFWKTIRLYVFE